MTLYFAYGSNMHPDQMTERTPSAKVRGVASLPGYRMVCNKISRHDENGRANLVRADGGIAWGVLYEVDESEMLRLDKKEGGYERKPVRVILRDGNELDAETYISNRTNDELHPAFAYKAKIIEGARYHQLPEEYIALLEAIECHAA